MWKADLPGRQAVLVIVDALPKHADQHDHQPGEAAPKLGLIHPSCDASWNLASYGLMVVWQTKLSETPLSSQEIGPNEDTEVQMSQ